MVIFGTVGIFRRNIQLSSSALAMIRGYIGALFILLMMLISRKGFAKEKIRKNLFMLCLSGAFIGFNWILLFEAYNYTTVAVATLCYYMQTIFVIVVSPFLLKEKMTARRLICVVAAFAGMVLVSGVLRVGISGVSELKGIAFGLGAAVLYAGVVLSNKKITEIPANDKTLVQLLTAAVVVTPYTLLTHGFDGSVPDRKTVLCTLFVGVVITGFDYVLYFASMKPLKAQTIALFSYIDPVVAIILSAVLLHEKMSGLEIIGAVLVLGATVISELPEKKRLNNEKV